MAWVEVKKILLANALLIALYLYVDWNEYGLLSALRIQTHFPFYFEGSEVSQSGSPMAVLSFNFTLLIFLLATTVNLYYAYKLQKRTG
jgi:hypothetical protein